MDIIEEGSEKLNNYKLKTLYEKLWFNSSSNFKLSLKTYNYFEKKKQERNIDKCIDEFIRLIEAYPKDDLLKEGWTSEVNNFFDNVVNSEPSFNLGVIDEEMKKGFIISTKHFIDDCKAFDESLSYEDMGQALRNAWIVSILQKAFGFKVAYNKAMFAYSMLYPYTDNYLDDISIAMNEKKLFNERFKRRLKGEKIEAIGEREGKIYDLVSFIETIYPRDNFGGIYDSLLLIHSAQINSLLQQEEESIPYERDILSISIEKGGASVLADGYLINGRLDKKEEIFSYGYGFFLQLCDDLQDVKSDKENGHITIMSQLAGSYNLDKIVNKLINLLYLILDEEECFKCTNIKEVKELIQDNCLLMIIFAIIKNKVYFSKEYIRKIKEYLPVTIGYINNINKHFNKKIKGLQKKYTKLELEDIIEELFLLNGYEEES